MFTGKEVDDAITNVWTDPAFNIEQSDVVYSMTVTRAVLQELRESCDWWSRRRVDKAISVLEDIVIARVR